MASKQQVIDAHLANPDWYAAQIARHLGCSGSYVRATAHNCGLTLPRSPRSQWIGKSNHKFGIPAKTTLSKEHVAILAAFDEHKSYGAIVELTGLPIGTVKSRLSRARTHAARLAASRAEAA